MNTSDFIELTSELLSPLSAYHKIACGNLFGGHGYKANGVQFAMIIGNQLYFCVNESTRTTYIEAGMQCFSYAKKDKVVEVKKYYAVPEDLFDDPETFLEWAQEAVESAWSYPQKKR